MTTVHLLTPCIRPHWLGDIAESIAHAIIPEVEVVWHLRLDPLKRHANGWQIRNEMLDAVDDDGWVFLLDDDTKIHGDLFRETWQAMENPMVSAIVFSQEGRPDGWHSADARADLMQGGLDRDNIPMDACLFDTGQLLARRTFYGNYRFHLERSADGHLYEELVRHGKGVIYLNQTLSRFNAMRPGEWGS